MSQSLHFFSTSSQCDTPSVPPTLPPTPFRWVGRCLRNFANWCIRAFLREVERFPADFVAEVERRRDLLDLLHEANEEVPSPPLSLISPTESV